MNVFKKCLNDKLENALSNNFLDNYDTIRFGELKQKKGVKEFIRRHLIYRNYVEKTQSVKFVSNILNLYSDYSMGLDWLYQNLSNNKSRDLLVDLVAYLILGHKYVKLPVNNEHYWESIKKAEKLVVDKNDYIFSGFLDRRIHRHFLKDIGFDLTLYLSSLGVVIDFMLEQYAYKDGVIDISAKEGDVVIDAGACWGDTALYFASKVKKSGKVYSFEFIPKNIDIFKKNIELNKELTDSVKLINQPLWDIDHKEMFFVDKGPASRVSFDKMDNYTGQTKTITIDTLVENEKIQKVDFIKMDIEGAELYALKGAIESIKRFKPNLAIAIYHSMDDFVNIPKWINDLDLGYKLYLGHSTIHSEETVIFATTK